MLNNNSKLLDPYVSQNNEERVKEVLSSRATQLSSEAVPKGVSVIILTLNHAEFIIPLITHLLETEMPYFSSKSIPFEVIIGDTGTSDIKILDFYDTHSKQLILKKSMEYNFSKCNNYLAFQKASYDTLLFLNNDILFPAKTATIYRLYDYLYKNEKRAAVSPIMFFPDGRLQFSGFDFFTSGPLKGLPFHTHAGEIYTHYDLYESYGSPALTGACLMVRKILFSMCGGMDEAYEVECQDVSFCLELKRLGYDMSVLNCGNIIHFENGTRPKNDEYWKDRQRFMRKWGSFIEATLI